MTRVKKAYFHWMNTSNVQEIVNYLKHQDYALAVRRTLDTCVDTGDTDIIKEAIQWSRTYSTRKDEKQLPPGFTEKATEILSKAAALQGTAMAEKRPLLKAANISKHYKRGSFSLKPISLSLRTGDILGVVGESIMMILKI